MSFSNIALQHRERESKALRIFVAYSLTGSLIFHLTLLASGIINYLNRVPEIEEEPVEITLLDTPIEEIEPKEEEKPEPEPEKIEPKQEKPEPEPNITQDTTAESQISGGSQAPRLFEPIPTQPRIAPPPVVEQPPLPKLDIPPVKPISPPVVEQPVIPEPAKPVPQPEPEPILESKLSEEFTIPTTTPIEPTIPQPTPEAVTPPVQPPIPQPTPEAVTPPVQPPIPQPNNRELIDSLKQSQENTNISSNNTAPSLPDTSSTTPTRRRRIIGGSNIATAPSTDSGIGDGTGDAVGDGDGRAACRQCGTSYPSWARERRIEGEIVVAVDTDANGNVTNVSLISGSGNSRLDRYHLRLANNWKLKPSSNGRRGVRIETTYRIE